MHHPRRYELALVLVVLIGLTGPTVLPGCHTAPVRPVEASPPVSRPSTEQETTAFRGDLVPSPVPRPAQDETREIAGQLLLPDDSPLRGIELRLSQHSGSWWTSTDADGHYRFERVIDDGGPVRLWSGDLPILEVSSLAELPARPTLPGAALRVVIEAETGSSAIAAAPVLRLLEPAGRGLRWQHPVAPGQRVVEAFGLPSGRFLLTASETGKVSELAELELEEGELVEHRVVLEPQPHTGRTVRVLAAGAGTPVLDATVELLPAAEEPLLPARTGASGLCHLPETAGAVAVRITAAGFGVAVRRLPRDPQALIEVVLESAALLMVEVRLAGGGLDHDACVQLVGAGDRLVSPPGTGHRFTDLAAGHYRVSAWHGDQRMAVEELQLAAGETRRVVITTPAPRQIEGRLSIGSRPAAGGWLYLAPLISGAPELCVPVGADGSFQVSLWDPRLREANGGAGTTGASAGPAELSFRARYENGAPEGLGPRRSLTWSWPRPVPSVDSRLSLHIPAHALTLRVQDHRGQPSPVEHLELDGPAVLELSVDAGGIVHLEGLPAGSYRVTVDPGPKASPDTVWLARKVVVSADRTLVLRGHEARPVELLIEAPFATCGFEVAAPGDSWCWQSEFSRARVWLPLGAGPLRLLARSIEGPELAIGFLELSEADWPIRIRRRLQSAVWVQPRLPAAIPYPVTLVLEPGDAGCLPAAWQQVRLERPGMGLPALPGRYEARIPCAPVGIARATFTAIDQPLVLPLGLEAADDPKAAGLGAGLEGGEVRDPLDALREE